MSFPTNLGELRKVANDILKASRDADEEARRNREIAQRKQHLSDILERLFVSWQDRDPGKSRSAYFFLDPEMRRWVVVREFLPEGVKVYQTREEWERRDKRKSELGVPYYYPVVSRAEIGMGKCPECNNDQPVIEHYVQTMDSPNGDEWLKERLILCLECGWVVQLSNETSENRF